MSGARRAALPLSLLAAAVALAPQRQAGAYHISGNVEVFGYTQLWLTLHEQVEESRGLFQHPSGDEGATSATGFSIHRARLGLRLGVLDGLLSLYTQFMLEEDPQLLDLALGLHLQPWLVLVLGQQKIPSTYENGTYAYDLDFILPARISTLLADYSLSRTSWVASHFYGVRSNLRDMGLSLKGEVALRHLAVRYQLMVGNGMGANLFIGGGTNKEFIVSNNGQLFYGARLELAEILGWATVGAHVNYNRHDNMVFNSGRVVYDLNRYSTSGDLQLTVPGTGLRLVGLYGGGVIDDDYDDNGEVDVAYRGGEGRAVWRLNPLLGLIWPGARRSRHRLDLGLRFEEFSSQWNGTGVWVHQRTLTAGLTYLLDPYLKVQLDYLHNTQVDPDAPDLDDDALILAVQGYF